ncbi:MAG TPA: aminotransferase class I/II-fold pyridoxal phosphate-dependent enzyme [Anaeromyxobacteraceae bacterium]|nr:aminotransferase class I/II-fold pyridoxal phosphate-dependent enzyme [Anaeromyxobacteraceae bacterium]
MTIKIGDIGRAVRETAYAVRGPIVARAQELEREGREIIYCNIGNPQALEQKPLTWIRQILALCEYPELMDRMPEGLFPADAVEMARHVLRETKYGTGAYTDSKGFLFVREAIARFIRERDGIEADPEAIYLTDGASKGVRAVLSILVDGRRDGILIPTPQYPLYSATITLYEGTQLPYPLDEDAGWRLTRAGLERAYDDAVREDVRPRAVCVINPGNPSGAVLDEENVAMVLDFARERDLAVLADEVYQENVYRPGDRFVSFASLLERKGYRDVSLFSFHSTSKGLLGECGQRGGYLECRNVPPEVMDEITKLQSVSLCANTAGQIVTFLMVTPPRPGGASCETYQRERREIFESLARRAGIIERGLNRVEGIHCNPVTGAMYAFPRIDLPPGTTDEEYCLALLEETGICVVPGSGFGQAPGTAHFRTTTLPPAAKLEVVVERIGEFHARFHQRFGRTG